MNSRCFPNRSALDQALANSVAGVLAKAIEQNGSAALVVSGGSTPLHLFRRLSSMPLEWHKVTVLLADERWVPPDHDDSNERLVRKSLLVSGAASARFVPLKTTHANAQQAESSVHNTLAALGRFDLVILGVGDDGHTASLFPCATALPEGLDMVSGRLCLAIQPRSAPHQRMTMTLPRLLDSENIFIHITGEKKKSILDLAWKKNDPLMLPIAAVIHQQFTPVTLFYAP